jgi:predicted metal-dependent phosphoesterase TrpH
VLTHIAKFRYAAELKSEAIVKDVGGTEPAFGQSDLHIHTRASDGLLEVDELLAHVEQHTDLDVIAVTDHDVLDSSLRARDLAVQRRLRCEVVTGMEVTTADGHMLALFIEQPVASYRPSSETVAAVHALGGICIAAHPLSWLSNSLTGRVLGQLLDAPDPAGRIDGIETLNNTLPGRVGRKRCHVIACARQLPQTGGSDAHFLIAVGSGRTEFPGHTAADLRRSIVENTCRPALHRRVTLADIGLGQLWALMYYKVVTRKKAPLPVRAMLRNVWPRGPKSQP